MVKVSVPGFAVVLFVTLADQPNVFILKDFSFRVNFVFNRGDCFIVNNSLLIVLLFIIKLKFYFECL